VNKKCPIPRKSVKTLIISDYSCEYQAAGCDHANPLIESLTLGKNVVGTVGFGVGNGSSHFVCVAISGNLSAVLGVVKREREKSSLIQIEQVFVVLI
jgi:hypothetical protein